MTRPLRSQSGFTLLEMLLAMALFAMVMAGVYSAMRIGLNARKQRQAQTLQTARATLNTVGADVTAAFSVPDSGSHTMNGSESTIAFFTFPRNATQPERTTYFIGDGKSCRGLCRTVNNDPFNPNAPEQEPVPVAPDVSALKFSYYDGAEWHPSWRSPGVLPERVRIAVDVQCKDGETEHFETQVNLPTSGVISTVESFTEYGIEY